jgi:hypothetical protein
MVFFSQKSKIDHWFGTEETMHPSDLRILKYLLRRGISKHVTINIMGRLTHMRHHCTTPYNKCHGCKQIIQTCRRCDELDITRTTCRYCDKLFCDKCAIFKDKRKRCAFVCDDCYCACAVCGNNSNHTCRRCGYELCYECYNFKKIEYIAGDSTYEICWNCRKRICG